MIDKLKSRIKQAREDAERVASEHLLKGEQKVSPEIQEARIKTCQSCKHLQTISNQCRLCGCFMGVKTWMKSQKCPINKWGPGIDIQEVE